MARVPYGGVDAVSVFVESTDGGRAVECPELDGVVPGGGDERVTADGVVVNRLDLASVFLERADWIGGRREREVVDLDRAVGDGGDKEGIVGFRPGEIVNAVGGVEGSDLGER